MPARTIAASRRPAMIGMALVFGAVLAALTATARGEAGALDHFPRLGVKTKTGLSLDVDSRWPQGFGYRPVRVTATVTPAGTAPADRVLLVELVQPRDYYPLGVTTVSGFLELPQGSSQATMTLAVPIDVRCSTWQLQVYEDGYRINEFSQTINFGPVPSTPLTSVLVIDSRAAPLAARATGPADPSGGKFQLLNPDANVADFQVLPPGDVPDEWLHYSGIDFTFVSLDALRQLKQRHPRRLAALRRWAATGTTLCVYGVGENYEALDELDELLELPAEPVEGTEDEEQLGSWRRPAAEVVAVAGAGIINGSIPAEERLTPQTAGYVARPLGLGVVAAIASTDSLPRDWRLWSTLAQSQETASWWGARNGVSPDNYSNSHFLGWLIPSVESSPVTAFRVLITLFAIAIGPVNYFVLSRINRTYLMLVTAPLAAAIVLVVLVGYAGLKDGFGVKARIRSLTLLDQRNDLHVSLSRQSYFAAFAGSQGMTYPGDTAVYPLDVDRSYRRERRLDWRAGRQRLIEGYLPARETVQMVAVRSASDAETGVDVHEPVSATAPLRVDNRLGCRVRQLLVVDSKGDPWWADGLEAEASQNLHRIDPAKAHGTLRRLHLDNVPEAPEFVGSSYRMSISYSDFGVVAEDSLLERKLRRWLTKLAAPRSYVAVVEAPPGVPLGVSGVSEEASFHVVAGRW